VKLVVILGHSDCGAIKAAIGAVTEGKTYPSSKYGEIGKVVDLLVPTVKSLPADQRTAARQCDRPGSGPRPPRPDRRPAVQSGAIQVVAGVYNIANGAVSIVR
jgi:carbonic anhydrase